MNYRNYITKITDKRKKQLLDAEKLYLTCLENNDFYNITVKINEAGINKDTVLLAKLQNQKADILKKIGLHANALTPPPACPVCLDTGFTNGNVCKCVLSLASADVNSNYSGGAKNFNEIDYTFYENNTDKIKKLAALLDGFCEKFPNTNALNILLFGNTGTGKTYLAKTLANCVSLKGSSVVFISAFKLIETFLKYHTTFDDSKTKLVAQFFDCDLLVIDDLGTEGTYKNVTLEYLYHIINERVNSNKHTVITSNLNKQQIENNYGMRIASRLFDKRLCFLHSFEGKDLRTI